jgi:hypothetical protein
VNNDVNNSDDERLEERYQQLGTRAPRCYVDGCSETNPFALSGIHPDLICAEHRADKAVRSWLEQHHIPGRANDGADTQTAPANDHAVLSEYQRAWPRETLRNPDGGPLLRAAAMLRGWLDVLRLIMERTVGWIPNFLEALDRWLRGRLGPRWWDDFLTDH